MASQPCNIICLKWGGYYPAYYVNILYHSVRRHLQRPLRFVCITEDAGGLDQGIEVEPIPPNPLPNSSGLQRLGWPNIFLKLILTRDGFANMQGDTLFLDLDIVLLKDIECFFDYKPGNNCIIRNWIERRKRILRPVRNIGNSSVFRFNAGKSNYIYEMFLREVEQASDKNYYRTEQAFLTHAMVNFDWWPATWVASFKHHCRPTFPLNLMLMPKCPRDARILVFHGMPKPHQAAAGFIGQYLNQKVRPSPWILDYWHV